MVKENRIAQRKFRTYSVKTMVQELENHFKSIEFPPDIYIEVYDLTENSITLNLSNFVTFFICEQYDFFKWIHLHLIINKEKEASSIPLVKYEIKNSNNNILQNANIIIKNEMIPSNIINLTMPSIIIKNKKITITGLSSVLRFIVSLAWRNEEEESGEGEGEKSREIKNLLGYLENTIKAPSEVSIFTKFCEIEIIDAVSDVLKNIQELKENATNKINLSPHLFRFEDHLQQPLRIKDSKKVNQKRAKISKTEETEISHDFCYAEMTLADLVIYPSIHLLLHLYGLEIFNNYFPKVVKWYNIMLTKVVPLENFELLYSNFEIQKDNVAKMMEKDPNISVKILANFNSEEITLYRTKVSKNPNKQFTKDSDISQCFNVLEKADFKFLEFRDKSQDFDENIKNFWTEIPSLLQTGTEGGSLPEKRQEKKSHQLSNMVLIIKEVYSKMIKENNKKTIKIVDFCAGSGHLGLLLGYLLPQSEIVLVENKEESLRRAVDRAKTLNLNNISFFQSNLDYFNESFDIGISLHACGAASDLVMEKCIRNKAAFVCCPCCYGMMSLLLPNHELTYPRSLDFLNLFKKDTRSYFVIAHLSDNPKMEQKCMKIIDTDRALYAKSKGYKVELDIIKPYDATPKNHILIGFPNES